MSKFKIPKPIYEVKAKVNGKEYITHIQEGGSVKPLWNGKEIIFDKSNLYTLQDRPQVMNIISIPAPKRLWTRLIWSRIRSRL